MTLPIFTMDDLHSALHQVGVSKGDVIVVHSSLVHLGLLQGCSPRETPAAIVNAMRDHLGVDGTLAVLAPFYDYGIRGTPFDTRHSPVEKSLGVLSAYVTDLTDAWRSANPIFSVAAVGRRARFLCEGNNATAFGVDSPWDRLHQTNARIVFLGAPIDYLTFVRYIEHRYGVPYLYNKLFDVPVYRNKQPLNLTVVATLRYKDLNICYKLERFGERLHQCGVLRQSPLGAGEVLAVNCHDCFHIGVECLKENIYFFLAEKPAFVRGQIPFDVFLD